ncbi:MAG: exodeoxyribonuclease VII small subunit [Pseudomonadota bacterium]
MDEGPDRTIPADNIAELSFEDALSALERIVQQLERGDVPLDQSITLYERGEKLRAACQQRLDAAQAKIEKIVTAADGSASGTAPLDGDS